MLPAAPVFSSPSTPAGRGASAFARVWQLHTGGAARTAGTPSRLGALGRGASDGARAACRRPGAAALGGDRACHAGEEADAGAAVPDLRVVVRAEADLVYQPRHQRAEQRAHPAPRRAARSSGRAPWQGARFGWCAHAKRRCSRTNGPLLGLRRTSTIFRGSCLVSKGRQSCVGSGAALLPVSAL